MQTKFKRGQKVKLLTDPDTEYVENHEDSDGHINEIPIKKGMTGEINVILPNGQYHVEIKDKDGKILAYVPMSEEYLEALE